MKIYLTFLLSILLVPVVSFAATNDFVANGNITVSEVSFGAGTADMIIFNGSTAESWTFNNGTFTVTNPGSAFQVGSSDSNVEIINIYQGGTLVECAPNTTPGTSYATLPATAATYTITPSSNASCSTSLCSALANTATYNPYPTCGAASCNAGYRLSGSDSNATCVLIDGGGIIGGGGGGGSSIPAPQVVTPDTSTTTEAATTTPPEPAPSPASKAKPSPVAQTVSPVFNKTLRFGITSDDVKRLQQLLASDSEIYPEGIVSGWFGHLTRKAVQRFQCKYNIVCKGDEKTTGYGLVGPKTRQKLQEVFGQGESAATEVAKPSAVAVSVSPVFNSGLGKGMSNSDIKRLQQLLNSDPDTQLAASGVGSPGHETEYFGALTEAAVQRFQIKYGVVSDASDLGYGYVGPKTRAKLQEVFGAQTQTQQQAQSSTETELRVYLETQLQELLQQVQQLQTELKSMQ